jgi:hypothetical protein
LHHKDLAAVQTQKPFGAGRNLDLTNTGNFLFGQAVKAAGHAGGLFIQRCAKSSPK